MNLQKTPPARDPAYLKFVRTKLCCGCFPGVWRAGACPVGSCGLSVSHHFGMTGKGIGQKCSDYETVPLCASHHELVHRRGPVWFQSEHQIDFSTVSELLNIEYAAKKT